LDGHQTERRQGELFWRENKSVEQGQISDGKKSDRMDAEA
jgi:hypothetical protein